jgi:hypothetical protein
MNWLCRVGLHSWEMVMERFPADSRSWFSRKCRRCGKKAKLP